MHRITSIASVMSLLAVSGFAQGSFGPTGGQNLFSIGGALSKEDINPSTGGSASFTTFNAQLGFGRFLTDVHEVGVQLNESYSTSDVSGVSDSISTGIAPYYNYNFRSNPRKITPTAGF